ncbi:MAG: HEPN domain-containing protein, partial [Candidatus Omnitrophica bacterium]|nr:HEPN domain-containing protein [Candidatus Omnitrophota bacterium]
MPTDFENCLKKGTLKEFSRGTTLLFKELTASEEDLRAAKESLAAGKFKWAVIQAYYSMLHSARALLYAKNYRERSHYCLQVAIGELYVGP